MRVNLGAKSFAHKSQNCAVTCSAIAMIMGLTLGLSSCAAPNDSKAKSEAAPDDAANARSVSSNAATAQSFAPVFLLNLESALTGANVPAETVTKIMSEIDAKTPAPAPALGLAASTETPTVIHDFFEKAVLVVCTFLPTLPENVVRGFVGVIAISATPSIESSVASSVERSLGIDPTKLKKDSPARAVVALEQILNGSTQSQRTDQSGNAADFLALVDAVTDDQIAAVCPPEQPVTGEALGLAVGTECPSGKTSHEYGGDPNKFFVDAGFAKCAAIGPFKTFCFPKRPSVGSETGLKTFDACIKCSNGTSLAVKSAPYPNGNFDCATKDDKDKIVNLVQSALGEKANECGPRASGAP